MSTIFLSVLHSLVFPLKNIISTRLVQMVFVIEKKKMHNIHNVNTLIKLMGEKKREIYVCIVLYNTNQNNCLTKLCSVVFIDTSTLSWNVTTLVIVVTLNQELHLLFSQKKKSCICSHKGQTLSPGVTLFHK